MTGGVPIRYFGYVSDEMSEKIFYKKPEKIDKKISQEILKYSLGATLYMPGTRDDIGEMLISKKYPQLTSLIICLEDSIKDEDVCLAEQRLKEQLKGIKEACGAGRLNVEDLPFIFIRVRTPEHLSRVGDLVSGFESYISGFVFPKFDLKTGQSYINNFKQIKNKVSEALYFMPILESENVIYAERRQETLNGIKELLEPYKDHILNIRIGSTDFSSLFGIRRGKDYTIYEIQVVRDCITDILNYFNRCDQNYVVSGPVWEYFEHNSRFLKPLLRATPFNENFGKEGLDFRSELIQLNLDGLIKETLADKENGMIGKTVIHPSHILIVNSIYAVTHEEYIDALEIIMQDRQGGVSKSQYKNKMNEIKPHTLWAEKIIIRAKVYGVLNENYDCLSLISQRLINYKTLKGSYAR